MYTYIHVHVYVHICIVLMNIGTMNTDEQFLCYYIYFNILFSLVFELNTYKNVCLITLPRFYLHQLMPWAGDMAF